MSELGIATVLERHPNVASPVNAQQDKALWSIAHCRTARMGWNQRECNNCGERVSHYNSCRNRHCPSCQGGASRLWVQKREQELLPAPYFHMVFTLPSSLRQLCLNFPKVLYEILFKSSSYAILKLCSDPKHLGAQPGFLAVLHTWGQQMVHHPHLHMMVVGAGWNEEQQRWIKKPKSYFLPIKALSLVFRGRFIRLLRKAFDQGGLLFKDEPYLSEGQFKTLIRDLYQKDWVVYAKKPFAGPEQVVRYIGRYTHRVALSNRRIKRVDEQGVKLEYKDYREEGKKKPLQLSAKEFFRRFLQHVLPKGFQRIRQYGFLANPVRKKMLIKIREHLGVEATQTETPEKELPLCPQCKQGELVIVESYLPKTGSLCDNEVREKPPDLALPKVVF